MRKLGLPNDIDSYIALTETSMKLGNYGNALGWYRLASEYYPDMYEIIDGMCDVLQHMKKEDIDAHLKESVAVRE